MFDEGLHFQHELKSYYKIWEQEIAKRNKNWQDGAARTKNELQSVIKKDNRRRKKEPAKRVDG